MHLLWLDNIVNMNHKIWIHLKWKWFCIPIARTNTIVSFNLTSCILHLTGIKIQSPVYPFLGRQALGMGNSTWLTQPMRFGHGTEIKMISQLLVIVTRFGWEAIHLTPFAIFWGVNGRINPVCTWSVKLKREKVVFHLLQ